MKDNAMVIQVVVEFDRNLFRHVGVAQWNGFVGELVRRGMTPVAWSKGERPPPVGVMFDFRGLRVPHCRLAGLDFTFCDLAEADFAGSSLKGAKLGSCPRANLRRTWLQGAEFRGDVSGANFTDAKLEGANFSNAYYISGRSPVGLPPDAMAAIKSVPEEPGGGLEAPFEQPLRARLTIHEVPW